MTTARAIAFHLPQFHPIPENDEWWGRGFTEWTNVTKARSLFPGHYQPHLPADLGFYDLRLPEARAAQAGLAQEYGIHGFCYYHYWFNGRRVLERPFNEILASGEPDFPFCLCWANENWTRRWDGLESEVLLHQRYSAEDDLAHLRALVPAFRDRRYLRVDGKPLFLVYRAMHLPEPRATTERWRAEAVRHGLPGLFLVRVESFGGETGDPRELGFDAAVEFQPHWDEVARRRRFRRKWWQRRSLGTGDQVLLTNTICEYDDLVDAALARELPDYPLIRCICPGWDNSARRSTAATVLHHSTPEAYERWLAGIVRQATQQKVEADPTRGLVFINAWNEWAEGNHLEPCRRWGRAYLEATRRVLSAAQQP